MYWGKRVMYSLNYLKPNHFVIIRSYGVSMDQSHSVALPGTLDHKTVTTDDETKGDVDVTMSMSESGAQSTVAGGDDESEFEEACSNSSSNNMIVDDGNTRKFEKNNDQKWN